MQIQILETRQGKGEEMKVTVDPSKGPDQMQELVDALTRDKMDDKGNLQVDYKNGELSINGKKQPEDVLKKYSKYFSDKKDFIFSIKVNEN